MALYVKFAQEKRPRTVREFLKKYYSNYCSPYYAKGHDTYRDPICQRHHCSRGYRSFDDLFELVKTYYPSIDEKKMMHYLLTTKIKFEKEDKYYKPHLGICETMNRIRFIPYKESGFGNIDEKMAASKYTWRELLTPLGINNVSDFNEYIKNSK